MKLLSTFMTLAIIFGVFLTLGAAAGTDSLLHPACATSLFNEFKEFLIETDLAFSEASPALAVLGLGLWTKPS